MDVTNHYTWQIQMYHSHTYRKKQVQVLDRKDVTQGKKIDSGKGVPLTQSCNLTIIQDIIGRHWHILQINSALHNIFKKTSIYQFRWNRSLKEIVRKTIRHENNWKYSPRLKNNILSGATVSRKQEHWNVTKTAELKLRQNISELKLWKWICVLIEDAKCCLENVGKAETSTESLKFTLRLNNHRKDEQNLIPFLRVSIS